MQIKIMINVFVLLTILFYPFHLLFYVNPYMHQLHLSMYSPFILNNYYLISFPFILTIKLITIKIKYNH